MEKKMIFINGIQSIGVHNNVARISFFTLNSKGEAEIVLELNIPHNQVAEVVKALTKVIQK